MDETAAKVYLHLAAQYALALGKTPESMYADTKITFFSLKEGNKPSDEMINFMVGYQKETAKELEKMLAEMVEKIKNQ